MAENDSQNNSTLEDADTGSNESNTPVQPTPDESVQAPQSDWFKKSIDITISPNENIEAPKSQWLNEGFDFNQPPSEDD